MERDLGFYAWSLRMKKSVVFYFSLDDLLEAGILNSDTVVVTRTAQSRSHHDERDEEFMADAMTIVSVQTIFRLACKCKNTS